MANVLSLVSYKVYPAKLGGQKGIAFFYKFFCKYHNITWVTVKDNDPSYASFKVLNILSNSKFRYINLFYYFRMKKIIKELKITHLILEHPYYGWLGIWLKKSLNIKLIIHSHNIEAERFRSIHKWWWKILWNYEKWIHKNAEQTFCKTKEDREYMINRFKIHPEKCQVITYGIEWDKAPTLSEKISAAEQLKKEYHLENDTFLFLFNGTLSYGPNYDAVKIIVNDINNILIKQRNNYKIIICGKGLPAEENELKEYFDKNIIYAGFVEDINIFFKGCDVFINPVVDGGGIKTKLVEALANNMQAISCVSGAIGMDRSICNNKLEIIPDNDWIEFANKMATVQPSFEDIGKEFFLHFYWDAIAAKASTFIN